MPRRRKDYDDCKCPEPTLTPLEQAAKIGDLETVKQLYPAAKQKMQQQLENASRELLGVLWYACAQGHLNVVTYAHEEQSAELFLGLYRVAAYDDHVHIIKYLYEKGIRFENNDRCSAYQFMRTASFQGSMQCIEFVFANGMEFAWDNDCTLNAATNGHLSILQFAHERGLHKSERTVDYAAANGHLECLQYAFENGFPHAGDAAIRAAQECELECLRYCIDNKVGWQDDNYSLQYWIMRECIDSEQMESLEICLEYSHMISQHLQFALKAQKYDFAAYIYKYLRSRETLDADADFLIEVLNNTTQKGNYNYYAVFRPKDVSFDDIKHIPYFREMCYFVGKRYRAYVAHEEKKACLLSVKHATLASLLDLVLAWEQLFVVEHEAVRQAIKEECKEINVFPADVFSYMLSFV